MIAASGPAVSVVVCSLGQAQLERTLASIAEAAARADTGATEIVVVWQDASPPPPVPGRLVEVFPTGVSHARNRGAAVATAPIVAFVDDDEVVDPDWIRGVVAAFGREPRAEGVFGAVEPLNGDGFPFCSFDGAQDRLFRGRRTPPWTVGTGGNMAFRRRTLLDCAGFDHDFGPGARRLGAGETELVARLLGGGALLRWTPEMRVFHPRKSAEERLEARYRYGYGLGSTVRRHRRATAAGRYLVQAADALARSLLRRDRRRIREVGLHLNGFARGLLRPPPPRRPPDHVLDFAPAGLAARLAGLRLEPLAAPLRARPHFVYGAGDELALHVYVNPADGLRSRFESREALRAESGLGGVPALHAVEEGFDSLWVLETRLPGAHPSQSAPEAWFDRVAAWAHELAGPPGGRLGDVAAWRLQCERMLRAAPSELRRAIEDAQAAIADLPAVRVHGDLSPKNVLVHGDEVGAVDWEYYLPAGMPGRDLVFLAVSASGPGPDEQVIARLARGERLPFGDLAAQLSRLAIRGPLLRPALLLLLAGWASDEKIRRSQLGAYPEKPVYAGMLERWGRELAARP